MKPSEACRLRAAECFESAQLAPSDGARAAWLNIAQLWLQLAQHVEQRTEAGSFALKEDLGDGSPTAE